MPAQETPIVPEQAGADQTSADELLSAPLTPVETSLPEVETLISREEFEREIPVIAPQDDSALAMPLETLEAFQSRLIAQSAGLAPESPAATQTTITEQAAQSEVLWDNQLAADPQLQAPLSPLESFELVDPSLAAVPQDADEMVIAYDYAVTGLEEADDQTSADLASLFNQLSALRAGKGQAANRAQLSARIRQDAQLLEQILASQGWYGAKIDRRLDRVDPAQNAPDEAAITVTPGARYAFSDIDIVTGTPQIDTLLGDTAGLQVGDPIIAETVQLAEAQIAVALPQMGYPFGEIGQRDILLDRDTGLGAYTLPVAIGPKSLFGDIRAQGDGTFDAEHIASLARFKTGDVYNAQLVEDLQRAMAATGLFSSVSINPERTSEIQAGEIQTGPDAVPDAQFAALVVEQQAGPPRTIAGSAGYGTGEGFQIEGSWTHRNLFPPEGALSASGRLGTKAQGVGVSFRRSNAGRRDRVLQLSMDALHSDYDAFEAFTGRVAALLSYNSTPLWQKPLTWAVGAQFLISNEQDFNTTTNQRERRTFTIGGLTGQIGRDTTDSLLDPSKGYRLTALVEPELSLGEETAAYVRTVIDGSTYLGLNDNLVLAGRVRFGTIQGIDFADIAPSRRLYGGGGGSVRGFGYQQLGPIVMEPNPSYPDPADIAPGTDPADLPDEFLLRPTGGRSQIEAAAEVRYRFGKYGIVGFVDAGQVYAQTLPQLSDIRYSVGLGARYYSDFGPFRLDVAMPLDRRTGESRFALYISIGQAF